jgi:hypothetical protein
MSIESQPFKASQSINAIDLTRDDSPAAYSEVEENFNANNPIEERVIDFMAGSFADTNKDVTPARLSVDVVNAPIILDSDEEDEGFSSDSDVRSEDGEIDEPGLRSPYESEEVEDSEDDESIDVESIKTANKGVSNFGLDFFGSDDHKPATSVKTLIEVPEQILGYDHDDEDYDDEEYESDFGLSKAGRDGLQKLRDDGLLGKVEDNPFVKVGKKIVVVGESHPEPTNSGQASEERKHATFTGICWEKADGFNTSESDDNSPELNRTHTLSFPSIRQPSPSDAAMVKPTTPVSRFGVNVCHLPTGEWRQHIAQSLGEKTGKHAFFEARDHNRASVQAKQVEDVQFASSSLLSTVSSSSSTYEELNGQRITEAAANKVEERRRIVLGEPMPTDVAPGSTDLGKSMDRTSTALPLTTTAISSAPSLPYLDDHSQVPPAQGSPSPEPDMTSAVSYNESKAAMVAANNTAALFSGRSGLSINDIIDDATTEHTSKLKRKADDISEVIENEVREWASSLPVGVSGGSTDVTATQTAAPQEPSVANFDTVIEQRPTKKIRRFVERLGYAAAGGAAVGGTLFLALVATAPDFL